MQEKVPIYEEFYNEVKKGFWYYYDGLTEKEVDEYSKSEEKKIKRDYKSNLEKFTAGKITWRVFLNGGASAVAYCLQLMY